MADLPSLALLLSLFYHVGLLSDPLPQWMLIQSARQKSQSKQGRQPLKEAERERRWRQPDKQTESDVEKEQQESRVLVLFFCYLFLLLIRFSLFTAFFTIEMVRTMINNDNKKESSSKNIEQRMKLVLNRRTSRGKGCRRRCRRKRSLWLLLLCRLLSPHGWQEMMFSLHKCTIQITNVRRGWGFCCNLLHSESSTTRSIQRAETRQIGRTNMKFRREMKLTQRTGRRRMKMQNRSSFRPRHGNCRDKQRKRKSLSEAGKEASQAEQQKQRKNEWKGIKRKEITKRKWRKTSHQRKEQEGSEGWWGMRRRSD